MCIGKLIMVSFSNYLPSFHIQQNYIFLSDWIKLYLKWAKSWRKFTVLKAFLFVDVYVYNTGTHLL